MKKIRIKRIKLLNFKGIRNMTIDFHEHETNISGANGTGKTTVADAYSWLLFGKDSKDRKEFNIKTLDSYNKPIPRIPHEVSAELLVDGEVVSLRKCYTEQWTKKRGSAEETFTGHSVECFYNEVPCSVGEYAKKIDAICPESVYKIIRNPLFFPTQKKDFQRQMLFTMAGEVTTSDIVDGHPELAKIAERLSGKTADELRKELQSKKRTIKQGIENIPARIDERRRDMPEERDWSEIEASIQDLRKEADDVEAQMADISKAYNEQANRKNDVARQLSEVKVRISQREYELKDSALADYNKSLREYNDSVARLDKLAGERGVKVLSLKRAERELSDLSAEREALIGEWRSLKSMTFNADAENFICPTCKRPLPEEEATEKMEKMQEEFNVMLSSRLENNKARGLEKKSAMEVKEKEIEALKDELFRIDEEVEKINAGKKAEECPQQPDVTPMLNADKVLIELKNKATDLLNQMEEEIKAPDTEELKSRKRTIEEKIGSLRSVLSDREKIARNNERILELEREYTEGNSQIAELEGVEYELQEFSKVRVDMVEELINGMFSIVRFKMFEQQINGGEVETCEAMIDGVPFSDLNSAKEINAGIDIINALSKYYGITAPLFIDNRESVSEIIETEAQVVNFFVDKNCKKLKIG